MVSYQLNSRPKIAWTAAQEKLLSTDYPFELEDDSDSQYVFRTYLQFLWLAESIMPLKLFVPSLLRVNTPSSPSGTFQPGPHLLHSLLRPLLQTTRSASNKYHIELPKILSTGGGAGEIEETVMWYALNHEPADDDLCACITEGPWEDVTWREAWLERMERREVQVQILLHFLLLSLPGPPPPLEDSSPNKRKRKHRREPVVPPMAMEDTLEAFMDKLSMWQLISGLENNIKVGNQDDLDWMQRFFTEVVNPQFANSLPEMCNLLHSKVFRSSPFSSSSSPSSPSSSRPASPDSPRPSEHHAIDGSSKHTKQREHSPALSATSSQTQAPSRSRSRSLSVSLAEERMRERERSAGPLKKRVLNREVNMSRGFKPKPRALPCEAKKKTEASTQKKEPRQGITLVEATPVKRKPAARMPSHSMFRGKDDEAQPPTRSFTRLPFGAVSQGDEEWQLSSTPGVLTLGGSISSDDEVGPDGVLACDTPTKRARLR